MQAFSLPHQPLCCLMPMPEYMLRDFIATVSNCVQTNPLAVVLEIFSQGQCDRLVVLNQQQCPVGVLPLQRLMPQLINAAGRGISLDVQQPLSALDVDLVEPIATLPAELSIEQFKLSLHSQQFQINADCDWAIVDAEGKFLGLLESSRLWQFIALSPAAVIDIHQQAYLEHSPNHRYCIEPYGLDLLVQLLERLPLPLMVQTSSGEVVNQNPAWCEQFGGLSNLDALRHEVEAILEAPLAAQSSTSSSIHCQMGNQPDTCICFLPGQNDQERVWQFVKISLPMSVVSNQLDDEHIWILLATDVTEQQQQASELAAKNADLIQLTRLKDEFLACISHELRTPLTAVLGLSTLLKDQTLGQLNERQVRYARLIHENGRHLMRVVNDILDLTRMETGQLELTLEPVQIKTVCDRAIEQTKTIQQKNSQSAAGEQVTERSSDHRFTLLIQPGLESFVADELRLRQMLVHLLSNAFKFTEAGGEIGLQVSNWEGWIAFTVWDTGIGIPEHQQHLIFQKFQQLENPLTRQYEGTGLGLVLTRTLARLHGGDVSFLSKQDKGSQFTLLLPPTPPYKRAGGAGEAEEAGGEFLTRHLPPATRQKHCNRLVLVVEAAPRFIEDVTEQLTSLGYWFVIARSGTEALEKARRLQPGAIFLNPLLPLLSGWDVLTLLKSDAATSEIPVIVTTTRAEKDYAFSNRADEFLSLPVQQQVLQQVLTRFCEQPSVSDSSRQLAQRVDRAQSLTILRLVTPHPSPLPPSLLLNHRVLEVDDLAQAALLARVWQPDVILLDGVIPEPLTYLKPLSQYASLAALPIVTLDALTTQAASQIAGLSVFPCLTPTPELAMDELLAVLQNAAGMSWEHSILLVDVATLLDLQPPSLPAGIGKDESEIYPSSKRSEWFQALNQYLQTAGFRGSIARSWEEVLQQIRQQSVDLLLICLGESQLTPAVLTALKELGQQHNLPPVLGLDQQLSEAEAREQFPHSLGKRESIPTPSVAIAVSDTTQTLELVLEAIAAEILPHNLSMEELLERIHRTLARPSRL